MVAIHNTYYNAVSQLPDLYSVENSDSLFAFHVSLAQKFWWGYPDYK